MHVRGAEIGKTSQGGCYIFEGLKSNAALSRLNVSGNGLGDGSGQVYTYALHPTLSTLRPTSYTLCTLHPTPYALHHTPYTPYTLHPRALLRLNLAGKRWATGLI